MLWGGGTVREKRYISAESSCCHVTLGFHHPKNEFKEAILSDGGDAAEGEFGTVVILLWLSLLSPRLKKTCLLMRLLNPSSHWMRRAPRQLPRHPQDKALVCPHLAQVLHQEASLARV